MNITTSPEGHAISELILDSQGTLEFRAMEVRKERTGIHAHVVFFLRGKIIAHSTFNVFREEERTRLCNAAHGLFNELDKAAYSKEQFRHDFGVFALDLQPWLEMQWAATFLKPTKPGTPLFVLRPYILQDAGTILFGPPGKGKSWIALAQAVSIDAGCQQIWEVRQGKALFVNMERSAISFQRRLWQVNEALGLESDREMLFVNARGHSLSDLTDSIRESVLRHGIEIVFLDSISRAGMGALAEDRTANAIVDSLNQLQCAWFAIGHTPRAEDTHIYGSVHFEAGEDIGIRMISQETKEGLGIGLEVTKANDIAKPPKAFYMLTFDSMGLSRISSAKETDFPDLIVLSQPNVLERIKEFILSQPNGRSTATEIATTLHLDQGNVTRILSNQKMFTRLEREGRTVPYGIVVEEDAPQW